MSPFFLPPCAFSPSLFLLSSFSPSVAYLRQCYPVRCSAGRLVLAAVPASLWCSVRAISMSPFFLSPCALSPSLFILSSFSPSVAYLRQCYPVRCPACRLVLAADPASLLCSVRAISMSPFLPFSLCTFPLHVHSFLIFPLCRIFAAVLSCSVSSWPFSARRIPCESIVFCAGDFHEPVFPSSLCTFPLPVHSFLIFPFCRIFAAVLSCSVSSHPFSARRSSGESIVFCAGDFHEPVLPSSLCTFPLPVHSFLIFPFCRIFAAVLSCSVSCWPFSARRSSGESMVFCAGDFHEPVFPFSLCTIPLPVHSFLIFPFCRIFAAVLSCSVFCWPFSARRSSGESIVFCAGDFHEPVLPSSLCTFPLPVHSFLIFPFCRIFAAVLSCSVSCWLFSARRGPGESVVFCARRFQRRVFLCSSSRHLIRLTFPK